VTCLRKLLIAPLILLLILPLTLVCGGQPVAGVPARRQTYEFAGGRWFDGQKFVARKFYTVGGLLTSRKPARVDSVIDLAGKFIVPPFGEAHNHNVDWSDAEQWARVKRMYLEAGVFYVKNPANLPRARTPLLAGLINVPTSIDAVFANGVLTATDGHPLDLVRRNIARGGMLESDLDGGFCWIINNTADLDSKWEGIKAGKPDFIKTMLIYSEEYAQRRDDKKYFSWKGLDPALLPDIVRRAHRARLPVTAHVESATDFHNALVAGVDEINHTPGFRPEYNDFANYKDLSRYEITDADARLAARRRVVVVTTLGTTINWALDEKQKSPETRARVRDMIIRNLRLLKKHGVRIAVGSDSFRQTSVPEALGLSRLRAFDDLTLLKMWCETTAAAIFPARKIGHLKEGYEASFLALSADPLQDFTNVQKIEMRVKQGEILSLEK
jgi:imidazolonepropionase-like amidohydrolase